MAFQKGHPPYGAALGGYTPWSKGLTKETDERVKKHSETSKRLYKEGKIILPNRKGKPSYWKGKHHSKEWKRRMSEKMRGRVFTKDWKRKISESKKGKKIPKLSETMKRLFKEGKLSRGRELSPCWKGGISFEPYGIEFNNKLRQQIKKRDDFTCQLCGDKIIEARRIKNNPQKNWLVVHHIDYNKKNNKPENLIALCHLCNTSVNTTREQWTKFFQSKILRGGILRFK